MTAAASGYRRDRVPAGSAAFWGGASRAMATRALVEEVSGKGGASGGHCGRCADFDFDLISAEPRSGGAAAGAGPGSVARYAINMEPAPRQEAAVTAAEA
eukprot:scaffold108607_cov57-Phaeocystis_antarctica.AAC.3